jgi:hypothetical protein
MKGKKLGLGVLLLLTAAFTACGQQYDNASDFKVSPLDGGRSAEITAYVGNKQTVNIPPRIEGMTITKIGNEAFWWKEIISITIPNSVTSIGDNAFRDCKNLASITIPVSVTSIGGWAFDGCTSLASITIPNSVTSVGEKAFAGTAWLDSQPGGLVYVGKVLYKYKEMPANTVINNIRGDTTAIAGGAFEGCKSLTSINIPEGVTSIGFNAFFDCNSLASVTIPASVTSIDRYAFLGTAWDWELLKSQPDGLVYVGKVLYKYKGTMPANTVINNIRGDTIAIAGGAFEGDGCKNLASITIPNSVTSIGYLAFSGCASLASITIPAGVTSISWGTFGGCYSLTSITVDANNPNYVSQDGIVYNKAKTTIVTVPSRISGSITIPEGVTSLRGFGNCFSLTSITIPNSVTSIGIEAFYQCISLTSITIPAGVKEIGKTAFGNWTSKQTIFVQGKANQAAADTAWGSFWRDWCKAKIVYLP